MGSWCTRLAAAAAVSAFWSPSTCAPRPIHTPHALQLGYTNAAAPFTERRDDDRGARSLVASGRETALRTLRSRSQVVACGTADLRFRLVIFHTVGHQL